ncbi:MAG: D-aminoacyl-tRNA deacylase [Pirellulaceae bacterium]|nr:MAG: D-aminoacyl-tRNA deacylase [Pirellulaceae bacterium]
MRAVIQRVSEASVTVDEKVVGQIKHGLVVLIGVEQGDGPEDVRYLANKTVGLRIFADTAGKMNQNVLQVGGEILAISQFTLLGDVRRGMRPSFTDAAPPDQARQLYQSFCQKLRQQGCQVAEGVFQADMKVRLINDGPVTILLDSRKRF